MAQAHRRSYAMKLDMERVSGGSARSFEPRFAPHAEPAQLGQQQQHGVPALAYRTFDVVVAGAALLVFLPLILILIVAFRVICPGPVFFVQQRVGKDGRLFPCFKFRTMAQDAAERLEHLLENCEDARREWEANQKLRCDPRITPIGQILRKTSLDEIPQLFNVLRGDMSIVGPRPIVEAEVQRYGKRFEAYCAVKPGLTGLWQVSGRNDVPYATRVRLDAIYVLRKSLTYDLGICFRTVPALLGSHGVY